MLRYKLTFSADQLAKKSYCFLAILYFLRKYFLHNWDLNQTSANQGPDLMFVLEAISKPLVSKLSKAILKTQKCSYMNPDFQPGSNLPEYQHAFFSQNNNVSLRQFEYHSIKSSFLIFTWFINLFLFLYFRPCSSNPCKDLLNLTILLIENFLLY